MNAPGRLIAGALLAAATACSVFCLQASPAAAQGLRWRLVAPEPPPGQPTGEGGCGSASGCTAVPVTLGRVGDIEFAAPNRGLLITAGNGSSVPAGVWEYNGAGWHELASVCGASDGRIAWSGENEFWTVSDGRPGQSANGQGLLPPLEDDTLCHFATNPTSGALEVVRSYAEPAFQASSYQPMSAAACLSASDCWFAGAPLPAPQPGAFSLHWNGSRLEAAPNTAAQTIRSVRAFEGRLLESVALPLEEVQARDEEPLEILHPFVLYEIGFERAGAVFEGLRPLGEGHLPQPEYATGSYPAALAAFSLSTDATPEGEALWAAAGPAPTPPQASAPGKLTVLRDLQGSWTQVLGPAAPQTVAVDPETIEEDSVSALAGEPDTGGAWLALETPLDETHAGATALATVVHVAADGSVSEEQLPSAQERAEGIPPQGPAAAIACPARNDCWLATTRGTLYHLSEEGLQWLPTDNDAALNGPLITFRPADEGLPQEEAAGRAGGEEEEARTPTAVAQTSKPPSSEIYRVAVPPYSSARSRLLAGDVLELSFRLPVKARVRLLARRRSSIVASTRMRLLAAGRRSLRVRLDPRQWPTKLDLEVHPMSALPTMPASRSVDTITTAAAIAAPPAGAAGKGS